MSRVATEGQAAAWQTSRLPGEGGSPRLGYLLKQAQLRFTEMASAALAPLGIGPREWAALNCLDEQHGLSQKEVAELLGVDRTTMVALIDELENKGLVERRAQAGDRRKNIVGLTAEGRDMMQRGARLADDCERRFLAVLNEPDAQRFKHALQAVIEPGRRSGLGTGAEVAGASRPVITRDG
jgi:DNA-binding MarR family transcriptional regulator